MKYVAKLSLESVGDAVKGCLKGIININIPVMRKRKEAIGRG